MRVVINLVLFLIICSLVWVLYNSIREPIAFNTEKAKREMAVTDRLKAIRLAEDLYRQVTGEGYTGNFDTLEQTLKNGKIMIISVLGNPDDPEDPTITYDTTYQSATEKIAELNQINTYKIKLDSLRYVPYGGGKTFEIKADTLTYQQTLVDVLEVKTLRADFMGKFGSKKYAKYDANYDPSSYLKFGDLNAPNLTGNWE